MATEPTVRLGVDIPASLGEEVNRVARAEDRSPDAFVQEALERALLLKSHRALQEYGNIQAAKLGLTESDVLRLIRESAPKPRSPSDKWSGSFLTATWRAVQELRLQSH